MSIHALIERHKKASRLYEVRPHSHKEEQKRWLYVTPEVYRHLFGPWEIEGHRTRAQFLLTDYQGFVAGNAQRVSLNGRKHRNAQLARMEQASEEVWEVRHQHPSPGLRAMARFADLDALVVFGLKPRSIPIDWLPDPPLVDNELLQSLSKLECEAAWKELFPDHQPVHGEDASEYLTHYTQLP